MTQEDDKKIYVRLFNIVYDPCGCDDGYRSFCRITLREIEGRYDEETLNRWIE